MSTPKLKHGPFVENPTCQICSNPIDHNWLDGDYTILICCNTNCWAEFNKRDIGGQSPFSYNCHGPAILDYCTDNTEEPTFSIETERYTVFINHRPVVMVKTVRTDLITGKRDIKIKEQI